MSGFDNIIKELNQIQLDEINPEYVNKTITDYSKELLTEPNEDRKKWINSQINISKSILEEMEKQKKLRNKGGKKTLKRSGKKTLKRGGKSKRRKVR